MHRDLKSDNILVDESGSLFVSDFGMATKFNQKVYGFREKLALNYSAPESFIYHESYGPEIDGWSIGCIIFEIIFKAAIFVNQSTNVIDKLELIYRVCGKPNNIKSPQLKNLDFFKKNSHKFQYVDNSILVFKLKERINNMDLINIICGFLDPNPSTRLSCEGALNSPYYGNVRNIFNNMK